MSRIDDYIPAWGMDLEEFWGLPRAEQERRLREYYTNGPRNQIEDRHSNLANSYAEIEEEFREAQVDLRDLERGPEREEQEDHLEDWRDILEEIQSLDNEIYAEEAGRFRDATDGQDINLSPDSLNLNGQTIVYTLGGVFDIDAALGEEPAMVTDNPYAGVTSNGRADGAVIADANGDGVLNDDDRVFAAEQARPDPLALQNIFINTPPDWHWELVSYDPIGQSTFKVTGPGGHVFVSFENIGNATFFFSNGITVDDLEILKTTWSPELLKQSFWAESNISFHEELFPNETDRLTALFGYNEALSRIEEMAQYSGDSLTAEQVEAVREDLELLYATIDDPSNSVEDAWETIRERGFTVEELRALLLTVAMNGTPEQFKKFFETKVMLFEDMLNPNHDLTRMPPIDIALTALLEMMAAPGNYDGLQMLVPQNLDEAIAPTLMGQLQGTPLMIETINLLKRLLTDMDQPIPPELDQLVAQEVTIAGQGGRAEITDEMYEAIQDEAHALSDTFDASYTISDWEPDNWDYSSVSANQMHASLLQLLEQLRSREMTYEEMATEILTFCQNFMGTGFADNFTSMFVFILDKYGLLGPLMENSTSFAQGMWALIHDGGDHPFGETAGYNNPGDFAEENNDWNAQSALGRMA